MEEANILRILHIVPSLDFGAGMTNVIINYNRHINREEILFDYMYLDESSSGFHDEIKALGGRSYFLDRKCSIGELIKKMEGFLSEHEGEYRILHCHPVFSWVLFSKVARKYGVAHIIAHSHATRYSDRKSGALRNRLAVPLLRKRVTEYMSCSNEARVLFGKRANRNERIFILNNAIDCRRYRFSAQSRESVRNEFGVHDETLIGNIGRFSREKNHDFLLDVFAELKKTRTGAKLILVGDGGLKKKIEEKISRSGLSEDVILTGSRTDVPALLSGMDALLLPSFFEGAPVSVIEAQTSGLPCVLSDAVTRDVGFYDAEYVSLRKPSARWTEAVLNKADERRDRSEAAGEAKKAGFEISAEAKKLEKYYMDLI